MREGQHSTLKYAIFSLIPAVILFGAVELVFRVTGLDEPLLRTRPLPGEDGGLLRLDPQLFWSVAPDLIRRYRGALVRTNSLGLRNAEPTPRAVNELRILSLGESTTFGVGVGNDETYTALLGPLLEAELAGTRVTTQNAGVPAWSSFQSLKYLELRGLALDPDVLLFYHEANDYLPSSLRDSSNNEIGVTQTDAELYASKLQSVNRIMIGYSGIYRYFVRRRALRKIQRFNTRDFTNPMLEIGLAETPVNRRLFLNAAAGEPQLELNEGSLGRRVSEEERWQILEDLAELADREGIALVVIHPSYLATRRHQCLLTRFAAERGVAMFDAHDSLHAPIEPRDRFFLDTMHPTAEGHESLARDLSRFLLENRILGGATYGLN
jgi:lysophospholipase L1-like esterase